MRVTLPDQSKWQNALIAALILPLALLLTTSCGDPDNTANPLSGKSSTGGETGVISGGASARMPTREVIPPTAAPVYTAETDQNSYVAGSQATATFGNEIHFGRILVAETAYLPGCSPFFIQQLSDGRWSTIRPLYVCIQEGIAVEVAAGDRHTIDFMTPTETGRYRLRYEFRLGCEPNLPLSLADCESQEVIFSNEFQIERAL